MKNVSIQLVFAAILLIISIGGYTFLYLQVQSQSAHAVQLAQQLKDKSQSTTRVSQAKAQLAQLAPQENSINQYFVSPNDIVPFLEQFTATGKYLGTQVDVVSVSASPGTPYGTLSLSLRISGPFAAVMRTVGYIEYGPYDITTKSLTLDSAGVTNDPKQQSWSAALVLTIATQASNNTTSSSHLSVPSDTMHPIIGPVSSSTNATGTPKMGTSTVATSSAPTVAI